MLKTFYEDYQAAFIQTIEELDFSKIELLHHQLQEACSKGKQVFILGNGGSASSASHWVCDFSKGMNVEGSKRFKIYSLTDNPSVFSALGNDYGYEDVFVEPLKNHLQKGDLVIALSVSGNSENLVQALKWARETDALTISLIGGKEGILKDYSDHTLIIPSENYGIVEDVHMYINHVISQYIYNKNKENRL